MNKADLVEQISAGKNISKSAASEIVDLIIHRISSAQKKGEHVTLSGLGHFQRTSARPEHSSQFHRAESPSSRRESH